MPVLATSTRALLTINGGSSSIRFALFDAQTLGRLWKGKIESIDTGVPRFSTQHEGCAESARTALPASDAEGLISFLTDWISDHVIGGAVVAIGHRVVHGGAFYAAPEKVSAKMIENLRGVIPLDQDHLPQALLLMEAFQNSFPDALQIACFDTAFHRDMPRTAQLLPIPRRYESLGVRRYGFHGLSYTYLMEELERQAGSQAARGRVILAHLGNGASLTAVLNGRPLDTSMGFTPASGLPMSTRSGDVDPGLMSFLARADGMDAERFNRLINHESGLLGVSETSSDMRELLNAEATDVRAAEAVELFCYQVRKWIGAFAAVLDGLDVLVFAGGIGENAAVIRARICGALGYLGVSLDQKANSDHAPIISTESSAVEVRVIRTDEEIIIARSAARALMSGSMQDRTR